jgi:N-acetylmuramoyl-L-alanine amidase
MLIAIDDGHGMETAGKRTSMFPGTNVFMRENEFNNAVAQLLKINLESAGFDTLMVAEGDTDIPLKVRTDAANKANADLYVSIHANAYKGEWGEWGGISTYHYPGSVEGKKAAEIIHKNLLQGTKLGDRGVLTENFHVLRETNMPAVLCECAFMDNLSEAKLLLTGAYRQECACEICKGICEYYGVEWVPDSKVSLLNELRELIKKYE